MTFHNFPCSSSIFLLTPSLFYYLLVSSMTYSNTILNNILSHTILNNLYLFPDIYYPIFKNLLVLYTLCTLQPTGRIICYDAPALLYCTFSCIQHCISQIVIQSIYHTCIYIIATYYPLPYSTTSTYFPMSTISYSTTYHLIPYSTNSTYLSIFTILYSTTYLSFDSTIPYSTTYLSSNFYYLILNKLRIPQLLLSHTQQPTYLFTFTISYSTTYLSSNFYYLILNKLLIPQLLPSHTILNNIISYYTQKPILISQTKNRPYQIKLSVDSNQALLRKALHQRLPGFIGKRSAPTPTRLHWEKLRTSANQASSSRATRLY